MGMAATKRLYTREEVARLATAEANPLGGLSIIHAQLFLSEIQVSNAIVGQHIRDKGLPHMSLTSMGFRASTTQL